MKKIIRVSALALLALVFVLNVSAKTIKGKVVSVYDGDTFTLLDDAKKEHKVRLNGIDCPEMNQDYGETARKFTHLKILLKFVTVEYSDKDKYGRILGDVVVDSVNLAEELIKNGLAWHYKKYNNSQRLDSLENYARKERINIWSVDNPVAPWDFRQNKNHSTGGKNQIKTETKEPEKTSGRCQAITKKGTQCKRNATKGNYCWQHAK
jgi:endonuclease YncB( thermonuclease family)